MSEEGAAKDHMQATKVIISSSNVGGILSLTATCGRCGEAIMDTGLHLWEHCCSAPHACRMGLDYMRDHRLIRRPFPPSAPPPPPSSSAAPPHASSAPPPPSSAPPSSSSSDAFCLLCREPLDVAAEYHDCPATVFVSYLVDASAVISVDLGTEEQRALTRRLRGDAAVVICLVVEAGTLELGQRLLLVAPTAMRLRADAMIPKQRGVFAMMPFAKVADADLASSGRTVEFRRMLAYSGVDEESDDDDDACVMAIRTKAQQGFLSVRR